MSSSDEEVDVSDEATIRPLNVVHSDNANSSSSENSNSGNEGAATSGGSSNSSPSASSSLRALHPHKVSKLSINALNVSLIFGAIFSLSSPRLGRNVPSRWHHQPGLPTLKWMPGKKLR